MKENFKELLTRPNPEQVARRIEVIDEITSDAITGAATRDTIPSGHERWSRTYVEGINVELLNADITSSSDTI